MQVIYDANHKYGMLYYTLSPFDNEIAYKNIDRNLIDDIVLAHWENCYGGPEGVYFGRMNQDLLSCDPIHLRTFKYVDSNLQDWIDNPKDDSWKWEKFWPGMSREDEFFNRFMKFLYLSEEIFTDGDFKNPIGVHYNPRFRMNVIHPGGMRQVVLHLFGPQFVKVYYFNTGGLIFNYLKYMKKISISTLREKNGINYTCDHGTFIPHIIKDTELIIPGIKNIYPKFLNTIQNINLIIEGEVYSPALLTLQKVRGSLKCVLKIKTGYKPTVEDYIKMFTYIVLNRNYKQNNYSIAFTTNLI